LSVEALNADLGEEEGREEKNIRMPVPLDYLKSITGSIFPVGLEPWQLPEFLKSSLSLLASNGSSISGRGKREGGFNHLRKEGENERKVERCVESLGPEGHKT
jgi:hypothetical protein